MAYENIIVDRKGAVGIITLNRPQALNALSAALIRDLGAALDAFEARWRSAPSSSPAARRPSPPGPTSRRWPARPTWTLISPISSPTAGSASRTCRKPIVAAVAGYALGGGCEVAMMCDTMIAADTAKFGQPEITIGTIPGAGGTQRLTRAVGKAKAMDMCLTGRMMDAAEAERSGLVSRVVPAAQLMDEALKTAGKMAELSRPIVMMAKEAVNRAFETTLAEGVRFERRLFHSTFATEDQKEGMAAFVEKRKPSYKNR